MTTFTYEQAVRYLAGDPALRSDDDRRDEARSIIVDTVWPLTEEDGEGVGEFRDWIAEGSFGDYSTYYPAYQTPECIANEWDEYQRSARSVEISSR